MSLPSLHSLQSIQVVYFNLSMDEGIQTSSQCLVFADSSSIILYLDLLVHSIGGFHKINTNGYAKNGFSSDGVLFETRLDSARRCIPTFLSSHGDYLFFKAKLWAILDGFFWFKDLDYQTCGQRYIPLQLYIASLAGVGHGLSRAISDTANITSHLIEKRFSTYIVKGNMGQDQHRYQEYGPLHLPQRLSSLVQCRSIWNPQC